MIPVTDENDLLLAVAHELMNPLTIVNLQVGLMKRQMALHQTLKSENLLSQLKMFERQICKINAFLNRITDFAILKNGSGVFKMEATDLAPLVKKIIEDVEVIEPRARIELQITDAAQNSLQGYWDRLWLEQAIRNLVDNGLKHGEGRGLKIILHRNENQVEIRVIDQGPGIPPDWINQIFEWGARAPKGVSKPGMGIGLYLVKQIIMIHKGDVKVHSVLGRGAEFVVTLPVN